MIIDMLPMLAESPIKFIPVSHGDELDEFLTFAIRELGAVVTCVRISDCPPTPSQLPCTFDEWLETTEGQEVMYRILNNKHGVNIDAVAAYFDTIEDIQQKALIWLWETWNKDPNYIHFGRDATSPNHRIALLTHIAIKRARCMYAKRRIERRENQVDLAHEDGEQRRYLFPLVNVPATDIEAHDRRVSGMDKRMDVCKAIEVVVARMIGYFTAQHRKKDGTLNKRFRNVPIEHITRTIIEGYMYHYTDRYSQTGTFRKFCVARGVSKNQIARWRPLIFTYLREELSAYAPA